MESSNPTLNSKVIEASRVYSGAQAMTIQGTVNKALILFAVLLTTAVWTWSKVGAMTAANLETPSNFPLMGVLMGAGIVGFILAIVTTFKTEWAPVTAPLYAACEGLVLGALSALFEMRYPGIVIQAVGLTFGTLFCLLVAYKTGWIQATPAFKKGIIIATMAIALFYIVVMIAGLFHVAPPTFINGGGMMGIGFSVLIVGIAALNLILDFDFIENASKQGLAKHMEWYGAFALMVTLIWLYMEILRLLSKVNRRD